MRAHAARAVFPLLLAILAGILANAWVAWVRLDVFPTLDGDAGLHGAHALHMWTDTWLSPFERFYPAHTYPPAAAWIACLAFLFHPADFATARASQAIAIALLAFGTGLLARRAYGAAAGLAAAACVLTFPTMWAQASTFNLSVTQAGAIAIAYAALPPGATTPGRALLAGLAFGAAALTHPSALYAVAPALGAYALGVGVAARRGDPDRASLRDVALVLGGAAGLALPWYLRSGGFLADAFTTTNTHSAWEYRLGDELAFLAWIQSRFLLAPHVWALLAGAVAAVVTWRRSRVLVPALAGTAGLLWGTTHYGQFHPRYLLPIVPMALVLGAAPLVLADRDRALGRIVGWAGALAAVAWGLHVALRWAGPSATGRAIDPSRDGYFAWSDFEALRADPLAALSSAPARWPTHGPRPHRGTFDVSAVVDGLAAHVPTGPLRTDMPPDDAPCVRLDTRVVSAPLLAADLRARGLQDPWFTDGRGPGGCDCAARACFVLTTSARPDALARWPVRPLEGVAETLALAPLR